MGLPMARRLREAVSSLRCFDAAESSRTRGAAEGLDVCSSIEEVAAEADVLLLMLPSSDVVEAVLLDQGVLTLMRAGSVVVDMGSSRPSSTRRLAERAEARGVGFVDAPVSGGVSGAEGGALTIMVGGPDDQVEGIRGLLEVMGSKVTHVGPAGAGHALKALNNLMSATHLLVSSEALLAGHAFGLDYQVMLDVINTSSGRSGSTEVKWPRYVLPGSYDSGFGMALMVKDMSIAVELAEELGWPAPLGQAAADLWKRAVSELPQGADHTEVVEWLRTLRGSPDQA
jgi:3-hydroxyisobutyrate dehydrogenase